LHDDLAVLLDDVGLDLARLADEELGEGALAVEDRGARLLHAARAERVGGARPAELREAALAPLEQRRRRPRRLRRRALELRVVQLDQRPGGARRAGRELLQTANDIHRLWLSPPTRVREQATCRMQVPRTTGPCIS